VEWYRRYVARKRSDIDQELADFRAGIGRYFSITFDLRRSVTLVALKSGTLAPHFASPARIRNGIHPTTVGERRPIMMRLKMMWSMAAVALCATSAFAERPVRYRLTPIAG
jgi:hypothetical protein